MPSVNIFLGNTEERAQYSFQDAHEVPPMFQISEMAAIVASGHVAGGGRQGVVACWIPKIIAVFHAITVTY